MGYKAHAVQHINMLCGMTCTLAIRQCPDLLACLCSSGGKVIVVLKGELVGEQPTIGAPQQYREPDGAANSNSGMGNRGSNTGGANQNPSYGQPAA